MTVLAIDLGGSGSRIQVAGGHLGVISGPPLVPGEHAQVVSALAETLGPVSGRVEAVAVSVAGLVGHGDPDAISRTAREHWGAGTVVVVSDAVAAVVGAWGEPGGAVVAAGTGVVGFGTDLDGVWVRSDGWGHELGDEGGAAWIGRRGLRAALRALDGRPGGSEALLAAAQMVHGEPGQLPALLRAAANPATLLGAFAPQVSAAAESGDAIATGILEQAAALLVETGLSVLAAGVPERLAFVGGLSHQPMIAAAFAEAIHARRPELELAVGPAAGSPLDGALRLAHSTARQARPSRPPYLYVQSESKHSNSAHDQGAT